MNFKKWLKEVADNYGAPLPPTKPEVGVKKDISGAIPYHDNTPLPGNKKAMKKKSNKK